MIKSDLLRNRLLLEDRIFVVDRNSEYPIATRFIKIDRTIISTSLHNNIGDHERIPVILKIWA